MCPNQPAEPQGWYNQRREGILSVRREHRNSKCGRLNPHNWLNNPCSCGISEQMKAPKIWGWSSVNNCGLWGQVHGGIGLGQILNWYHNVHSMLRDLPRTIRGLPGKVKIGCGSLWGWGNWQLRAIILIVIVLFFVSFCSVVVFLYYSFIFIYFFFFMLLFVIYILFCFTFYFFLYGSFSLFSFFLFLSPFWTIFCNFPFLHIFFVLCFVAVFFFH